MKLPLTLQLIKNICLLCKYIGTHLWKRNKSKGWIAIFRNFVEIVGIVKGGGNAWALMSGPTQWSVQMRNKEKTVWSFLELEYKQLPIRASPLPGRGWEARGQERGLGPRAGGCGEAVGGMGRDWALEPACLFGGQAQILTSHRTSGKFHVLVLSCGKWW